MNQSKITELALKLLAFGCFIYSLSHAGYSLSFLIIQEGQMVTNLTLVASVAPIIGPVIAGILLFVFAKEISQHLVSSSSNDNAATIKIDPKELHSVLLSIFGFALITFTTMPVFTLVSAYINKGVHLDPATGSALSSDFTSISYSLLFGYSFQLLLGIWFAFGAKGISGIIYKLRHSRR